MSVAENVGVRAVVATNEFNRTQNWMLTLNFNSTFISCHHWHVHIVLWILFPKRSFFSPSHYKPLPYLRSLCSPFLRALTLTILSDRPYSIRFLSSTNLTILNINITNNIQFYKFIRHLNLRSRRCLKLADIQLLINFPIINLNSSFPNNFIEDNLYSNQFWITIFRVRLKILNWV